MREFSIPLVTPQIPELEQRLARAQGVPSHHVACCVRGSSGMSDLEYLESTWRRHVQTSNLEVLEGEWRRQVQTALLQQDARMEKIEGAQALKARPQALEARLEEFASAKTALEEAIRQEQAARVVAEAREQAHLETLRQERNLLSRERTYQESLRCKQEKQTAQIKELEELVQRLEQREPTSGDDALEPLRRNQEKQTAQIKELEELVQKLERREATGDGARLDCPPTPATQIATEHLKLEVQETGQESSMESAHCPGRGAL